MTDDIGEYTVQMAKGQKWRYDVTFLPSLDPVVTIEYQGPSRTSTDGTYASVDGTTVTVDVPEDAPTDRYYIVIKAETSNPTQIARQFIKFVFVAPRECPACEGKRRLNYILSDLSIRLDRCYYCNGAGAITTELSKEECERRMKNILAKEEPWEGIGDAAGK